MGGTSKTTQTQTSSLAPYEPASGALQGILGSINKLVPQAGTLTAGQQGAINQVISNANRTPDYSAPINSGVTGLLNGGGAQNNDAAIRSNLDTYRGLLTPTATGANMGQNSALKAQLDQITSDVTNQVNSQWAAAGRDGSPGSTQALARGIASGVAPVLAAQYNTDADRALNAATAMYGAGNTTYGLLNDTQSNANTNFTNGIGSVAAGLNAQNAAPTAAINAMAQQFNIPASQLQTLLGMISPVAAQFGTQNGRSEGESTMSGAQQFATIASGIGSLWPKGNISFGAS
ncbi:MAG: tail fiber domain-containing protein [Bradyrhizobium sp.]|uniref:tail fiber domain-containing protein n=1 Tax=Bradyrhizobium sp. TaxID=376 RepID=UPI003BF15EE4